MCMMVCFIQYCVPGMFVSFYFDSVLSGKRKWYAQKIVGILTFLKISNEELWQGIKQTPIEQQIKERKWHWIGHILHKPQGAIERHTLDWYHQDTRNRGRPRATWKITRDWQLQKAGKRWKEAKELALDRTECKTFMKPCVPHRNKMW